MWLEPGDLQIINSHVTPHSRTEFEDYPEPSRERLLYRPWLAPADSERRPVSWTAPYKSVEPGVVRGGITGQYHDESCGEFERRQAQAQA